eukprot:664271-Pleurochrysis_carterae.AAC.1
MWTRQHPQGERRCEGKVLAKAGARSTYLERVDGDEDTPDVRIDLVFDEALRGAHKSAGKVRRVAKSVDVWSMRRNARH